MANTPEGHVKAKVRDILARYTGMYTYWPVPTGFGTTTIDMIGCYRGQFFAVETKAPGKKPTLKQAITLEAIGRAMGKTFVIDNVESPVLDDMVAWLDALTGTINDDPHIPPDPVNRRTI